MRENMQTHSPCLWMQAGVVKIKSCKLDYHCRECRYDRVMTAIAHENQALRKDGRIPRGNRGRIVLWQEKLRSKPLSKRPCVHYMRGRIGFRICNNAYHCGGCDFDQLFEDQYSVHAVISPVQEVDVKGFKVPQGYYFHDGHAWVKLERESFVRVGIDEFALRLFGPFDRIESPLLGRKVVQGRPDIAVIRGKNDARVLSPVSGVVTAVNQELRDKGGVANDVPYSEGWVMMVKPDNIRQDLKKLMIQQETCRFMAAQVDCLYREIETVAGPLAADGGFLGHDIYSHLPGADWKRLTSVFLKNTGSFPKKGSS